MRRAATLLLALLALAAGPAAAGHPSAPAEFTVTLGVAQTNPPAFGSEYDHQERINNWSGNPGMEPLTAMAYWEATGAGTDATGTYVACSTRIYDTTSSGFYDGGHYRIYRETTNAATGLWEIQKLREGTIPAGGYVAAGYEAINVSTVNSPTPNTDAVDNYQITNGATWYYAVKAHDTKGNWSAFSAPVSGVVARAGLNNGPRIATLSVSDPTTGKTYTAGSPWVTLAALGGTAPLTWSLAAGALPSGMQLSTNGAITGTCPTNLQAQFTVRVTDAAARTHQRVFTAFRLLAAPADPAPAAPSNVVCEANDGFVLVRWDLPPDTDVDYCQLYRSRVPAAMQMERIYLDGTGPAPAAGDLVFVEATFTNAPAPETRSLRVLPLQGTTAWNTYAGSGAASTAVTQEIVAQPLPLPSAFQAENPGQSCLKLACSQTGEFGIFQYVTGGTGDTWWGVSQFPTGATYRMECWVRGEGLASNTLRFTYGSYVDRTVTGIVNGTWTKLSADFVATNWVPGTPGVFGPYYRFRGPGTVYVDNAMVYAVNDSRGASRLSGPVYDNLWRAYVGPTNQASKGALRIRYLAEPLQHVVNPSVMSMRDWDVNYGGTSGGSMHLGDALEACYGSGVDAATRAIPWVTVNLNWKEQDFLNLVEFLAGPTNTTYGALRVSQRGGIAQPWTDAFRAIYLEMGNEPWNGGYFFKFRGGFSAASGQTYGRWCQYMWNYVATSSPYWSSAGNTIKVVLGGWAASLDTAGYSAMAVQNCPLAYGMGFTTYLGGWEANDPVGGTVWTDEGVQQWLAYKDRSGQSYIDSVAGFQASMAGRGFPIHILMYEGGPSYLQNGLNGVSLSAQEQETSRNYGRTLAAGVGTLDFWLYGMYRGVEEQEFFSFVQDQGLWCSHTPIYTGYRPHPAWQALQMFNLYASGSAMLTTTTQSVPTYDMLNATNTNIVVHANLSLASCYAFQRGSRYGVFVLNKKLSGLHDSVDFGNGHTPVTLHLPFTNAAAITLYKLSGDPRLTNRDQMNFQVATQTVSTASFSTNFAVNASTGGETDGVPSGVFLYVFDGATLRAPPANLQSLADAAGPGGTVTVDAGTYAQDLAVSNAVTLLGVGGGITLQGTLTLLGGANLSLATNAAVTQLHVTGSAVLGGVVAVGALAIDHGVTLAITNGQLVVGGLTLTGSFTLDEHWGETLVPQPLPFADDFELYAAGQPLTGLGYFGWTASDASVTVQNAVVQHGAQAVALPDATTLDAHVSTAATRLWTDMRVRLPPGAPPPDTPAGDESLRLYVTTNGWLAMATTNGGWDVCATDAFGIAVPPAVGDWVRLTLHHDYTRRRIAVFLNGRLLREAIPFVGALATNCQGFTCRNASGNLAVTPTAYIDRVSVTTTLPQGLDDLNAAHSDHGFDGDGDGMPDAVEIDRYGNLSTYWGQRFGLLLLMR